MRNYFVLLFRCWVACDLFSLRSPKNKKYHLWGFRQQGSCHRHGWRTKGRARRHWCDIGICSFLSDYICNVTFNVVDLRSKTCQSSIWSIESIQDRSVPNSSDITIASPIILSLICWAQVSGGRLVKAWQWCQAHLHSLYFLPFPIFHEILFGQAKYHLGQPRVGSEYKTKFSFCHIKSYQRQPVTMFYSGPSHP